MVMVMVINSAYTSVPYLATSSIAPDVLEEQVGRESGACRVRSEGDAVTGGGARNASGWE